MRVGSGVRGVQGGSVGVKVPVGVGRVVTVDAGVPPPDGVLPPEGVDPPGVLPPEGVGGAVCWVGEVPPPVGGGVGGGVVTVLEMIVVTGLETVVFPAASLATAVSV